MPQVRFPTSALANKISPDIKKFIEANQSGVANDESNTVEESAEIMAHAIGYGIAKAFSSEVLQGAFTAGIAPTPVPPSAVTAGGPVEVLIFNVLKPLTTEL